MCNFKGTDLGDGDSSAIFIKVDLGKEILNILWGILEDEMVEYMTDLWFQPHVTLFTQSDLTPARRAKLFKTASSELVSAVTVGALTLRERKVAGRLSKEPVGYQL